MTDIVILGVSADIGQNICKLYQRDGARIIGTYRKDFPERETIANLSGVTLIQCDLTNRMDIETLVRFLDESKFAWDTLFSSVGTSEPIGRFFDLDFDDWARSVDVNMISQLRAIHAIYPMREKSKVVDIALLAGGGTNNPFRCYSAYCVAKIGLIKMCELLDDEAEDVNMFILGPGFVKTKTHFETLRAGAKAETNLERVQSFMGSGDSGTSFEDIYQCLEWSRKMARDVIGGRNLSVVHDQWGTDELANELMLDKNMYKLRRHRNT
jgi:NAD(P)-dependent dehydrogenase (short-subunit alcohol dehydrogenase family)